MFDDIKKELYFFKKNLLLHKGIKDGKIVPFDEEFYEKMSHTYLNCISISMHIRYLKPTIPPGKCYERSLFMFFCFDDALLVRADVKDLEIIYGKEHAGHGWIEIDDYVYDPSSMMRFEKELYYKIYTPTNIYKSSKDEYKKQNGNYYDEVRNTSILDFKPGGRKRTDLCICIPLVKGIAEFSSDENFKKELDEYLETIQYDEKQVYEELVSKCDFYTKRK